MYLLVLTGNNYSLRTVMCLKRIKKRKYYILISEQQNYNTNVILIAVVYYTFKIFILNLISQYC